MPTTVRVARKVSEEFPTDADAVLELLAEAEAALREWYDASTAEDRERITAATVIVAAGRIDELLYALELMQKDWRDLLMVAGLENDDWKTTLDTILGPA